MKVTKTGATPRCIDFAGKRPNVLCIALEGRVGTSRQPMDLLCACIVGGGAAWVHVSPWNGSSGMCQTLHGNELLHSHWLCLTAQQTPLHCSSSDSALLPLAAVCWCQESKLYDQNDADEHVRKSEFNQTVAVLLPLLHHEAPRQFVTVSMPWVPPVGQQSKGHIQVRTQVS